MINFLKKILVYTVEAIKLFLVDWWKQAFSTLYGAAYLIFAILISITLSIEPIIQNGFDVMFKIESLKYFMANFFFGILTGAHIGIYVAFFHVIIRNIIKNYKEIKHDIVRKEFIRKFTPTNN